MAPRRPRFQHAWRRRVAGRGALAAWQNDAMHQIRIATRRSALALWQAEHVAAVLRSADPGRAVTLVPVVTQGDRIQDRPLAAVGGKGLFIKELEVAIAAGDADIAVHSMKDVPAELPEGFVIGAVLPRADPRDAFISRTYPGLEALPQGARVGTSSPRRRCILKAARPDLEILDLRGNVDTRLRRAEAGDFDAIILACAGLLRLGLGARIGVDHLIELDLGVARSRRQRHRLNGIGGLLIHGRADRLGVVLVGARDGQVIRRHGVGLS